MEMPMSHAIVAETRWESPGVRLIDLKPGATGAFPPSACGSHIEIALPNGEWRSYSLVNSPGRAGLYSVAVQRGASAGAAWLTEQLDAGQAVAIRGPHLSFRLHEDDGAPALFVAGGIGITPFLAMLDSLQAQRRDWRLVYAVRSRASAAFLARLQAHGGRVQLHVDDEAGAFLALAEVLDAAAEGTHVYVCGPGPMMAEMERQRALRPGLRFHREEAAHAL
jgi:ferredoxin-NADP reductase